MDEKMLWDHYGAIQKSEHFSLGPYYSYQMRNTPRHIIFTLARYKFAMKMIGTGRRVLELGCNEGLGSYYLAEFSAAVHGVDFDEEAITWAKDNLPSDKLSFTCDNFLDKKYGQYEAVVSYDVIEHIYLNKEDLYLQTVLNNLLPTGIFITGTPNINAEQYANQDIAGAHVNMYSGERFQALLEKYFHNVFLFGQNDEMIHTGYIPMTHYLIALCCFKKI